MALCRRALYRALLDFDEPLEEYTSSEESYAEELVESNDEVDNLLVVGWRGARVCAAAAAAAGASGTTNVCWSSLCMV